MTAFLRVLALFVFSLDHVGCVHKGFTSEEVNQLGTNIATEFATEFLRPHTEAARQRFIVLEDEQGWNICHADLIANKRLVIQIIKQVPARVPGVMFLMLALMVADSILSHRLCKNDQVDGYKFAGKARCLVQHLRYLTRNSRNSRHPELRMMKKLVVIDEQSSYNRFKERPPALQWEEALAPVDWSALTDMVPSLPALPSQPTAEDLAKLEVQQLAQLVASKFKPDPDCQVVEVKAAPPSGVVVIDDGDDEYYDCTSWEQRGYDKDEEMMDCLLGPDGQKVVKQGGHDLNLVIALLAKKSPAQLVEEGLVPKGDKVSDDEHKADLPLANAEHEHDDVAPLIPKVCKCSTQKKGCPVCTPTPWLSAKNLGKAKAKAQSTTTPKGTAGPKAKAQATTTPKDTAAPKAKAQATDSKAAAASKAKVAAAPKAKATAAPKAPPAAKATPAPKASKQDSEEEASAEPDKAPATKGTRKRKHNQISPSQQQWHPNLDITCEPATEPCLCCSKGIDWSRLPEPLADESTEFVKMLPSEWWPNHSTRPKAGKLTYTVRMECGSKIEVHFVKGMQVRVGASCQGEGRFENVRQRCVKISGAESVAAAFNEAMQMACDCVEKTFC